MLASQKGGEGASKGGQGKGGTNTLRVGGEKEGGWAPRPRKECGRSKLAFLRSGTMSDGSWAEEAWGHTGKKKRVRD